MKEGLPVVDAIIMLDGQNGGFKAWMDFDEAKRISDIGWENVNCINIRDAQDRPIPQTLKNGETIITDIMVRIEPNIEVSLN